MSWTWMSGQRFLTSLSQNLLHAWGLYGTLGRRQTRGGPSAVSQMRTLGLVCSWGLPWRGGGGRNKKTTSSQATFQPNIVIRRQQSKKTRVGEGENRPSGGKGWAQQPEADCRGQLHKITFQREKQGAGETEMESETACNNTARSLKKKNPWHMHPCKTHVSIYFILDYTSRGLAVVLCWGMPRAVYWEDPWDMPWMSKYVRWVLELNTALCALWL